MFNDDIKIHEARYANRHQDSIIVLFSNEKDPDLGLQETEVEVNEEDAYYQSLLSKVSIENIVDMTAEYKRLGSLEYNTSINNMVTKLATELAQQLYGQQIVQLKKEYEKEYEHYKHDLHAEKERYVKEITQKLISENEQYISKLTYEKEAYKEALHEEKEVYKEALHQEKEVYNKKLTETLIAEKDRELDKFRKALMAEKDRELDNYRNQINQELNEQYKEISKIEAELLAKDMLGLATMQEEKQRLLEEKEKLQKSVKDREEKLLGLDQAVKIQTNKADSVIFDFILDKNYEKEELFKFKLWALELDDIKKADKSIKSKIRKATSIIKAISILDQVVV